MVQWFTEHPDYLANPFYLGGDSYAGKIVPFLAQKISEDIEARLRPSLNLKGYLVGNPGTGESIDVESRVPYAHGVGIISDQLYETIMEHSKGRFIATPRMRFVLKHWTGSTNCLMKVQGHTFCITSAFMCLPDQTMGLQTERS